MSALITAPLLGPGYLLLRDAVSTPRSYLSDAAIGLSEAAPRALPQDFAMALVSSVVDGGVVVKVLLVGGLWLAGWGAARLAAQVVPAAGLPGQFVAATLAVWNPYVAERLLQGHWSLLVGYGCLPWVATAMLRLREGGLSSAVGLLHLAGWIALAGLTPTGLLLAAIVALVLGAVPGDGLARWASFVAATVLSIAAALPWLVAAAVGGPMGTDPGAGITAFAARAEPGLGTLGSLAGLGGIWNSDSVPYSRTTLFAVVGTVVLLLLVAAGAWTQRRVPAARVLLMLAVVAVVLPMAMATGPGRAVLTAVVEGVPGLGVLRDGHKWVALAVPGFAVAAAAATVPLRRWLPAGVAAAMCCVALIATLPDLTWGVGGKVAAVRYPVGWSAVAAAINAEPRPVAVLPADSMRIFAWSGTAPVLDPLPRWVRADVLTTGDLSVGEQEVAGEGITARSAQRVLLDGADHAALAGLGVGWVVVENGIAGEMGSAETTLARLSVEYKDRDITLYRVDGAVAAPGAPDDLRELLIGAHLVWLALLVAGAVGLVVRPRRRRKPGGLHASLPGRCAWRPRSASTTVRRCAIGP
ncbi:MAG: hypothetical protein ACSLE6_18225 [Mycobacterium sp.]